MTASANSKVSLKRGVTAVKIILFLLTLILFVSFVTKNMADVDLYYYNYMLQMQSVKVPLMIVILASFLAGFLVAWIPALFTRLRLSIRLRRQTKTIQDMNEQLEKRKTSTFSVEADR